MRSTRSAPLFVLLIVAALSTPCLADDEPLLVFAASSLSGTLDSLASQYMVQTGTPILIAYGASGSLAQQIYIGADVDLFLAADTAIMSHLATDKNSPVHEWMTLLRNGLVLITSSELDHRTRAFGPLDGPTVGKIAIADPESAPIGQYAADYLKILGLYDKIRGKLVIQDDARGVVQAVSRGYADVGFAYASDLKANRQIRSVKVIADSLHTPIVYGIAVMKGRRANKAGAFVDFLQSKSSQSAFAAAGFLIDSATDTRPTNP